MVHVSLALDPCVPVAQCERKLGASECIRWVEPRSHSDPSYKGVWEMLILVLQHLTLGSHWNEGYMN